MQEPSWVVDVLQVHDTLQWMVLILNYSYCKLFSIYLLTDVFGLFHLWP